MANTKITTNVIAADAITGALIADDVALGGNPTTTTQSAGNDTTRVATTAFVTAAIDNLVDSAPGTMNTLNEIAAALNDDANFNTTVTNSIAAKLPLAGGTLTGDISLTGTAPVLTAVASNNSSGLRLNVTGQSSGQLFRAQKDGSTKFEVDYAGDTTLSGTLTAAGGAANNNDDANILTLNASQHARLLVDTSSTSGHRANLVLESNSNETVLWNTGSHAGLDVSTGNFTIDAGSLKFNHGSTPYLDLTVAGTMKGRFYADANQAIIEAVGNSLVLKSASTTALSFNASQTASFAGTVIIDGVSNYTGLEVKGSGASRPEIKWSNVNQGQLGKIYGTEGNALVISTGTGGATAITIDSSQKVGIGAAAPTHNLSVSAADAKIAAQSTADSQRVGFQAKYINHTSLYGSFEYSTGDAQLWIDNNFIGNGTNYSDINIRNKDTSGNFQTAIKIKGGNAGNSGYIGIGVDSPNTKLHVVNNVNAYTSGILLSNADSTTEASGIWHDNSGNTSLNIETRYNSALAEIKLNLRTSSTAVNALTLSGDGSTRRHVSTDGGSNKRYTGKSNVIQTTGLVGYWDPSNTSSYSGSGTSIYDLSGNSKTLTMASGFGWGSNSDRAYFTADGGSNAYASGNLGLTAGYAQHFSYWVYWGDVNNTSSTYYLSGIQIGNHYMYLGVYGGANDSARMYGYIGQGTNIPSTTSGTENAYVASDEWVYLTIQAGWTTSSITRSKGRAEVYINGSLVTRDAQIATTTANANGANSFYLGRVQGGYYNNGYFGPAVVYQRMLHQWEINENMKVHAPMYIP